MTAAAWSVRHLLTAAEAERELGIKASTVRCWRARRRLWPYGLTIDNDPMYDRADLLKLRDRI